MPGNKPEDKPDEKWTFLGSGTYNMAYLSPDGKWVLKLQKGRGVASDDPERSVRLWNIINSHIKPEAEVIETNEGRGWICPFIEGRQSSDEEMARALVDIFNRTGRIVVDATAPENFITTNDGQVVCVDIGMAVQLEQSEAASIPAARRRSHVSQYLWVSVAHNTFFASHAKSSPETIKMIKALLFIKIWRPDIVNVDFLKSDPTLVEKLAQGYDKQNADGMDKHLELSANPAVIPIPFERAAFEIARFRAYLRSQKVNFTDSDLRLSATYENNNAERYVNLKIRNPEILNQFDNYVAQKAKAKQQYVEICDAYGEKLDAIVALRKKIRANSSLSRAAKQSGLELCDTLITAIKDGMDTMESELWPEQAREQIDGRINMLLYNAAAVARTDERREMFNDFFTVIGSETPFIPFNYDQELECVKAFREQVSRDPALSADEKRFLIAHSSNIIKIIEKHTDEIDADLWAWNEIQTIQQQVNDQLYAMETGAKKIARTDGFHGLVNNLFTTFGLDKPFEITDGAAVNATQKIRKELTEIRNMERGESSAGMKPK